MIIPLKTNGKTSRGRECPPGGAGQGSAQDTPEAANAKVYASSRETGRTLEPAGHRSRPSTGQHTWAAVAPWPRGGRPFQTSVRNHPKPGKRAQIARPGEGAELGLASHTSNLKQREALASLKSRRCF